MPIDDSGRESISLLTVHLILLSHAFLKDGLYYQQPRTAHQRQFTEHQEAALAQDSRYPESESVDTMNDKSAVPVSLLSKTAPRDPPVDLPICP